MVRLHNRWLVGAVAALTFTMAACGGGSDKPAAGSPAGAAAPNVGAALPPAPTATLQEQVGRYSFTITSALDTFARSSQDVAKLIEQPLPEDATWRGRLRAEVDRRKNAWGDVRKAQAPACLSEVHTALVKAADADTQALELITTALGPIDAKNTDVAKVREAVTAAQRVATLLGDAAQQAQKADCKLG